MQHSDEAESWIMDGSVRHRRFIPVEHQLNVPLFMPCIDLDQIDTLEKQVWGFGRRWWHWARFRREDYVGEGDLKQAVLDKVTDLTGDTIQGRVKAVIHLRYLGLYFSPVNFYYVYDHEENWRYLLAEVSNTPWNERHYYVVPAEKADNFIHGKAFHVSPFNPIDQQYQWRVKPLSLGVKVHLSCQRGEKQFDATLSMKPHAFTSKNLIKKLVRTPLMALKVVTGIYWHALKLWVKGAPVYSHPGSNDGSSAEQKKNKE